jgi:hypothetical protein
MKHAWNKYNIIKSSGKKKMEGKENQRERIHERTNQSKISGMSLCFGLGRGPIAGFRKENY